MMRVSTLAIALLAHLAFFTTAAPLPETSPNENAVLEPRLFYCSNYPSHVPGSYIAKRSLPPSTSPSTSPVDSPDLTPHSTRVNWCRHFSTQWLYFSTPGPRSSTRSTMGELFTNALSSIQTNINAGHGNTALSSNPIFLGSVNGFSMFAHKSAEGFTWNRLKVAVEILQNYVYVKGAYESVAATVLEGAGLLGSLTVG